MTAGQGGPYGDQSGGGYGDQPGQGGPPQGWNAPPSPPQNPPPPGQPWPGYAPAPGAPAAYGPGSGGPAPLERPVTVRAGLGAFVANLVLGLVASIITFADVDTLVAKARGAAGGEQLTDDVIRSGLIFGAVIALVLYAVYVLFLWFAWKGHNWARIVLWVLGGLSVVGGLVSLAAGSASEGFLGALGVCQLLLVLAGIVLLALKPSNDWYRYRSWQRSTGQR